MKPLLASTGIKLGRDFGTCQLGQTTRWLNGPAPTSPVGEGVAVEPVAVTDCGGIVGPLDEYVLATVALGVYVVLDVVIKLKVADGTFWFSALDDPLATAALVI